MPGEPIVVEPLDDLERHLGDGTVREEAQREPTSVRQPPEGSSAPRPLRSSSGWRAST